MINNIHCLVKTSMLLLQSASVEFLSLDSIIKYNTVLSLVMCPLCRYRITKTGDESALYEPEAPQMLPGCPALWWLSGLDAEQWAPCVCVTGSLPGCAQTDYPVWTSVTLDAHQSLLLSVVWFQTSGTGQSCVWLTVCVCVVWSALPWGQRRWRTRTGVRSLGLRSRCPVGPEAPDRLWPRPTSWRHPWCTAPPGTGTPTCPRAQREMEGYPLWRSGHYICQHSERNRGP